MKFLILLVIFYSFESFACGSQMGVVTNGNFSVTGTSTQILPNNALRSYLMIQNQGSNSVLVKFGSAQSGVGILLVAGGNYEMFLAPRDAVWMESVSGTQTINIVEGQ